MELTRSFYLKTRFAALVLVTTIFVIMFGCDGSRNSPSPGALNLPTAVPTDTLGPYGSAQINSNNFFFTYRLQV